jgi:polysaccharide biosynthesis transport protein
MAFTEYVPDSAASPDAMQADRLHQLAVTLMRGKWVVVITLLATLSVVGLYLFLTKPLYEATTSIMVEERSRNGNPTFLDITASGTTAKITNELEALKAITTAEAVARELLDKTYVDTARTRYLPIIRAEVDSEPTDMKDSLEAVALRLLHAVEFNPVKESDIIRISARSHDPEEAALIVNTYARVYVERNMSASRMKSHQLREFLETQMAVKQQNLDSTEQALQSYMRNSGVVSLDAEANTVVQQLSALEATRDGIDVDISTREKTLNSYKQELAAQEPNVAKAMGESSDTYIRLLQEQLAKLEVQRDVVVAQNPDLKEDQIYSDKLKEIDSQIQALRRNLKTRTLSYLGTIVPGEVAGANEGSLSFISQVKQRIIEQQIELDGLKAKRAALISVLADYERQFNQIPEEEH